jgi:DNA polymerase III subunit epsilon
VYGIFMYEDQNGYMRLAIEKRRKNSNPVYTFHFKVDGHGVLKKLIREFSLCPKLCFIQNDTEPCIGFDEGHCQGACEKREETTAYNARVLDAIASLTRRPSYVVLDKGLTENELSCIMVVRGAFFGMGYLPRDVTDIRYDAIKEYIKPYKENSYIRTLLHSHFTKFPDQVRQLDTPNS